MIHSFYVRRLNLLQEGVLRDTVFVFLAADEFDENSFVTVITADILRNLEPEEIILVVRENAFAEVSRKFKTSRLLSQLLSLRLHSRVCISIVSFSANGGEVSRAHFPDALTPSGTRLETVTRRLITAIFRDRNGFVESTASYHFENPSGKHTERFIRLSNILHSSAEISLLAFCALPYIPGTISTVYIDTPALFSLVSAINDHLRSLAAGTPSLMVESFGSYQGLADFRFDEIQDSVALISASSSGSLAHLLMSQHGFEKKQVVHFLFLGETEPVLQIVGDLAFDNHKNPLGYKSKPSKQPQANCVLCEQGSIAIPLRGDQFEPSGPQTEPMYLRKADAPEGLRSLVGDLAGNNIFGIGLGSKNFAQPRLYNIDPARLVTSGKFSKDLEYIIRRSTPAATAHVVYLDDGSAPIAQLVAAHIARNSSRPDVIGRAEIDKIPTKTSTPVVLVAAVIESGRSLLDVSRDLRTITPAAPLVYIIGMNKTTGEEQREALTKNLTQTHSAAPHEVISVRKMILPASVEDHSWAREADVLRVLLTRLEAAERASVESRIGRLVDRNTVLYDDVFLPTPTNAGLEIRPGFVFAAPDGSCEHFAQSDVYFIISSVLQRLRANSEKPGVRALRSNWFQQTVLAPDTFSRFNDGIIQAAFLRAATPSELNYVVRRDLSRELSRIIKRILLGGRSARGEAALEFLMALATRRLTLHRDDLSDALSIQDELPPLESGLLQVCRERLLPMPEDEPHLSSVESSAEEGSLES